MPHGVATALIAFGAVLTSVNAIAGAVVAGLGVGWEFALFYMLGSGDPDGG